MADVPGKFYRATKVRTGVAPSSAGSIEGEVLPPVNPPGSSLNSVGLTMPSAFTVSNSPLTANGTIGVTGAGTVAQYIRGDGSLADFPESSGGGSSVSYYLNGSVDQGTIGGVAYKELSKVPILGAGTDFSINADGYIASFITDAGDPSLLEIPGGNWNFETYFSASSSGGTPTFYVELYKVSSGGTATLIASSSSSPELIAFGTNLNPYFSTLAVPTTTLALTDRLAVRYYVTHSGRTITLHTENNHLCQIVTTFTTGITALNGLTAQVQNFAVGTTGTDFNIASAVSTHTFNLPTASATNRGALSSADWSTFNAKQNALTLTTTGTSGAATLVGATLNIPNYGSALSGYLPLSGGVMTGPITTPNGTFGIVIGDDSRLADRNIANTLFMEGNQNNDRGYINFSETTGNALGAINGGDLTWRGNAVVTGTGSAGQVAYWSSSSAITGESNLFWDATNDRLGIGINTPQAGLHLFSTSSNIIIQNSSTSSVGNVSRLFYRALLSSGNTAFIGFIDGVLDSTIQNTGHLEFYTYNNGIPDEGMRIFSGGNVHIGPSPSSNNGAKLQVNGTATIAGLLSVTGNISLIAGGVGSSFNRQISLGSGTAYNYQVRANGDDFQLIEAGSHVFLEYDYGGSLGAGTIRLYNNTVSTASFTGSSFIRTGGTSSQYLMADGSVSTLTNPITGSGNSGTIPVFTGSTTIGNSIIQSNSTQVNIVGNGSQLLFDSLGSTKDGGIQYINSFQLLIFNSRGTGSSINLGDTNLDFNTNSSGNPKLRITQTGAATFSSSVTASSFIRSGGTSSQYLMADGSVSTLSNPITGTGTTNYLPKFTGSTTIGNSQIIDNGTQVGIGLTPNASYGTLQIKSPSSVYSIDLVGRTAGLNSENQITFWNSTQTTGLAYITNTGSNLYLGTGANQPFTLSSGGNFIFGTTSDNGARLQVNGTSTFSGTATFSLDMIVNGVNVGRGGGSITTNTRIGTSALNSNTTGSSNTAVGFGSLQTNTTGTNNTAIGLYSLLANTTGVTNTAVGVGALTANTTGNGNSAFGLSALALNTTGTNNSALGLNALVSNTTGGTNTSLGFSSLGNNTTGSNNAALGSYAGSFVTGGGPNNTSSNSVYLGADSRGSASGNTNEIVIGYDARGQGSNTAVIGNSSITKTILNGNVGIGLNNPQSILHINGALSFTEVGFDTVRRHRIESGHSDGSSPNNNLRFLVSDGSGNTAERMRINGSGNLLIATTTDTGARLNVGGSYQAYPVSIEAMAGGGQLALTRSGAVTEFYMGGSTGGGTQLYVRSGGSGGVRLDAGATSWVSASDIRLKDVTKIIDNAVESLSSLQTIYYSWKDSKDKKLHIGLIAQEVERVYPEIVSESKIDGMKGVNYTELIPVLIASIKELKQEIDTLKN